MHNDRFDKFTERARKVLTLAQEEATRFNHNYIGTEHLLLGLVREGDGVAARVLASLGVERNNVRSAVEFIIGRGDRMIVGEIGLTPRSKKVIELSVDEARRFGHHYIGTEHLLLGLVREGEGIAAGVLESLGVNLDNVRQITVQVLSQSAPERGQSSPALDDIIPSEEKMHPSPPTFGYAFHHLVHVSGTEITCPQCQTATSNHFRHCQNCGALLIPEQAESSQEPLHWTPARSPQPQTLAGTTVRLEPVNLQKHLAALFAAAQDSRDPALWDYMSVGPFASEDAFRAWLETTVASTDPLFFTVIDQATNRPEGMVSYLRITPAHGVIEIGNIWFGPTIQRTRQATEAIYLLARHVFEDLGYRRLEWKCNARNARSRRAAARFGFQFEGVFAQHMVIKDHNRDTAWFAILDRDWPQLKTAFTRWLSPDNFDDAGQQRQSLATIRSAMTQQG